MQFCDTIIKRKACFSPNFFCGDKLNKFTLKCESQFTSVGQIFNLYEFQMVSDILGHPVFALCCGQLVHCA